MAARHLLLGLLLFWAATIQKCEADRAVIQNDLPRWFKQPPFVSEARVLFDRTTRQAERAIDSTRRGLDEAGEKQRGYVSNMQRIVSERVQGAFQTLPRLSPPYEDILAAVHEGGLLSVAQGFHWVGEGKLKRLAWTRQRGGLLPLDIEGSEPDHCLPGYSPLTVLRQGALSRNVEKVNRELASAVIDALSQEGWEKVTTKDGITVWRRDASAIRTGRYPEGVGPPKVAGPIKFLCVRAMGMIDAPLPKVYGLFRTNEFVLDYNKMCQECADVGFLDPSTKLTWAASKRMGPFAPRDFVTRCHYRRLRDGSLVLATMSEQLPCEEHQAKGEASGEYCRMDVTLGGYVLRPVDGGRKTEFHVLSMPLAPQLALSLAVREVGPFD